MIALVSDISFLSLDSPLRIMINLSHISGKLKMEFAPSKQYSSRSDIDFRDLYIAVNKPSNVSIYFDPELKWLDQPTLKLRRPHTNNNCNYKLTFEGIYRSICLFGKFTCVAVTDAGERISKSAVISSIDRTQSKSKEALIFT